MRLDWYKTAQSSFTRSLGKAAVLAEKDHDMWLDDEEIPSKTDNSNLLMTDDEHIADDDVSGVWEKCFVNANLRLQKNQTTIAVIIVSFSKSENKRETQCWRSLTEHDWLTLSEFQWAVVRSCLALSLSTTRRLKSSSSRLQRSHPCHQLSTEQKTGSGEHFNSTLGVF